MSFSDGLCDFRYALDAQTGVQVEVEAAQRVAFCPPVQLGVKMTAVTDLDMPWVPIEFQPEAQASDCTSDATIPVDLLIFDAAIYRVSAFT